MKKIFFLTISMLAIVFAIGISVLAADTASVGATVTVQNISVSVSSGTVAWGTLAVNTASSTNPTYTQTATNDGNVAEDFNVKGMDATGSTQNWTLAGSAGSEAYVQGFCITSCTSAPTGYTALTTSYATLATNIAATNAQTFDLYINTPTVTTDYSQHTADITVQAVQH